MLPVQRSEEAGYELEADHPELSSNILITES